MAPYWKIDECAAYFERMKIRGWCFLRSSPVVGVEVVFPASAPVRLQSYGVASPDVAQAIDPAAQNVRFDEWIDLPDHQRGRDFILRLILADGRTLDTGSVQSNCREGDQGHACWHRFLHALRAFKAGEVLEIGSRARSGITRRELIPSPIRYVGLDAMEGPNVDIVGDAHALSRIFAPARFDAVFSLAVFEHLAMPWKVIVETNRVLKQGGLVFINSQQTWPVHEEPCDFWRYTAYAWRCLLNPATGFEIIEAVHGEPARVHPLWDSAVARDMAASPAYLCSSVVARKIGETKLDWEVAPELVAPSYPKAPA